MILIIFFIFIPLVSSEWHTFMTAYTSRMIAGIPEFVAVSSLDGHQIDYYDSNTMIRKQHWMKEFSENLWKDHIKITEKQQQVYKNNIDDLMRFNQTHGVHTYQRRYGCEWDDETKHSHEFDEYGYDGEDFISLNLTNLRYTAHVPQAKPTVKKWNNDRAQLKILQEYFELDCVQWLKEFWHFSKATFEKADPPKVSLLQKNPDYYVKCHVTGFLFRNTIISWRTNGRDINSSSELVETGETRPNEDGTFQRSVTLYVLPDEWKKSQYTCVVKQSLTETIQKNLIVNEIKSNESASDASYNMYPVYRVIVIAVLIVLYVLWKCWKELKACIKRMITNVKNQCAVPKKADISTANETSERRPMVP